MPLIFCLGYGRISDIFYGYVRVAAAVRKAESQADGDGRALLVAGDAQRLLTTGPPRVCFMTLRNNTL